MPTVIDSLVVTLGLDPSGYRQGQKNAQADIKRTKDEARAAANDMEASGKKAAQFFGALRTEVVGLFAAFTGGAGLETFTRQTIATDAATGRLARNLGVATEELSAWQGVVKRTGGTAADADTSIQSLATAFQQIQLTGQSSLIPYLQTLGISLKDLSNPSETLLKIADRFGKLTPARATALGQGLGFSPAMINVLEKGRAAVQQMLDEQARLGVITRQDAEAAAELQNTLSGLGDASTKLGRDILTAAIPALQWLGKLLTQATEWAQDHAPVVRGAFIGLAIAATALGAALAAPVLPFILIGLAAAALGAAIGFLIDDFQKFREGVASAIDWGPFADGIEGVREALSSLTDAFGEVFTAARELIGLIPPGVWNGIATGAKIAGQVVLDVLARSLRVVADGIRTVLALLHGDWAAAWADAVKVGDDFMHRRTNAAPGGPAARPAPPPPGALTSFDGAVAYFRSKGFGNANARGIAAGISAESRFDPNSINPTSGAYGLGQWLGIRKAALFAKYGPHPTAQQQLDFMAQELTGTEARAGRLIGSQDSEQGALNAYITQFMRPAAGGETSGDIQRGRAALAANPVTLGAGVAAASAPVAASNDNRSTSSTEIHIGQVNVHTAATDARGIANDIVPAIKQRGMATQANTGLD